MANHNNYANDRDLMMEAYASVQGEVPATSSTAMPRMLNEAHCDEEHEDAETRLGATNEFPDGEGKYEVVDVGGMHGQSKMGGKKFNSLADACAHAGCDPSEITSEEWIDMEGDGTTLEFMVDEDTAIVMHKNVPAEDGSCKAEHEEHEDGGCATHSDEEHAEDAEEVGFNSKQIEELEDIVNAILDKRDSEERAAEHYS